MPLKDDTKIRSDKTLEKKQSLEKGRDDGTRTYFIILNTCTNKKYDLRKNDFFLKASFLKVFEKLLAKRNV